jgi:hypothetical protein
MMPATQDDTFSRYMEAVARKLLGDPNKHMSSASELRFGSRGSLSVDLEMGVWSDHEAKTGGGVMDLLKRELRLEGREAIEWLNREVGAEFEDRKAQERGNVQPLRRIVAEYDYTDEAGELLFQVVRFEPKDFRQRRPDPQSRDGWSWSIKGVRQVPYQLRRVVDAIAAGVPVFIVEGEKDVDALARHEIVATCNAMGAGKWPAELAPLFKGADVVILPDNDDAGRNHAAVVASGLQSHAKRVRVLELTDIPPKGDVSDWLNIGGDALDLFSMVEKQAKAWTPERPQSRFGAIVWEDVDKVTVRQDWLIEDMAFAEDVVLIFGASGSGKSFLAVDMAASIARGVPFLGKATRQGSVLYQAGEGGRGLVKRIRAYRQHHMFYDPTPFILLPARVDLFSSDGDLDAFVLECQAWQAYLPDPLAAIFIDTLSTASPGANENASEDMSRLIKAGETINKATGAALFWVHHKNAAGDRERGHTSLRANSDAALDVTKDDETGARTLRLAKQKDGEDGLKIGFALHPVQVGTYDSGKPMTSCVVVPVEAEPPASKRFRLPRGQHMFLKVLDDAIRQKGGVVPVGGEADAGTYGVEWPYFRDLYKVLCGAGKEAGAIRTALSRDGDAMWRSGVIGRHNDWLWITPRGEALL